MRHGRGGQINHGGAPCISFGGMRVDRAVAAEVIARMQPLGVEAALSALEAFQVEQAKSDVRSSWPLSRPATRPPAHDGSKMPSIPTTASSRPARTTLERAPTGRAGTRR